LKATRSFLLQGANSYQVLDAQKGNQIARTKKLPDVERPGPTTWATKPR